MYARTVRGVGRRREATGTLVAALSLVTLTIGLDSVRERLSLASVVLLYLVAVVTIAAIGGLWPAVAAAVASDLLVNFFFVPPFHTLLVANRDHLITLVVYVVVAVTVALAVDVAAWQRASAARSGVEADLLARISAEPIGAGSTTVLLGHLRDTLRMESAALLETGSDGVERTVAGVGPSIGAAPSLSLPAGPRLRLAADGPAVFAPDPRFLRSIAAAAARAWQAERMAAEAARSRELAEIDRLRAALLAAVGHDLRTPLAAMKLAASSLRDEELVLSRAERSELLATVEVSVDRMVALVENLLDMSRLQAGALSVTIGPVGLDEVVARALLHVPQGGEVVVEVPEDLPLALVDAGLLERVVANLVANSCRLSPPGQPVTVVGRVVAGELHLAVVDHGPGLPVEYRPRLFQPFSRLDDSTAGGGLGLGLALAYGFVEAMGGTLTPSDTAGGGLTMTIAVREAP